MTRASELLQYGQFTVGSAEFAVGASSAQGGERQGATCVEIAVVDGAGSTRRSSFAAPSSSK